MSRFTQGILSALLGAGLWGFSGSCAQYLFSHYDISPLFVTVVRMICAGLLFLVILVLRHRDTLCAVFSDATSLRQLAVFGCVGLFGSQVTYVIAVSCTNAGTATVLQCLSIVFVMIFTCALFRRAPKVSEIVAFACAFSATVLIATKGDLGTLNLPLSGLVWGVVAALAAAFYIVYPHDLFERWGSFVVTGLGMLAGGCGALVLWVVLSLVLPVVGLEAAAVVSVPALDAVGVLVFALFVFVGTFCAFGLYLHGVSIVGGVAGGLLGAIEPVSATLFSAFWLSTAFFPADWAGLVLMVATIAIVSLAKRGEPKT